jgi:serine/threonine protein phosphatase PrpC
MSDPEVHSEANVVKPGEFDTVDLPRIQTHLDIQTFGLTDRGRVREINEDQFLVATLVKALKVFQTSLPQAEVRHSSDSSYLFVVADGMGGHAAGEEASALAIESVEQYVLEALKWFACCRPSDEDRVLVDFQKALGVAHQRVRTEAAERPELRGMGTTLTLAYSLNDELYVAHVGDSRCYLLRDGQLYRVTQDHSLVEEMIRRGLIKPEEAAHHRWRHVITSTVGGDSSDVRVDVHKLHLAAGDVVLLCSDGLTEMVADEEIAKILVEVGNPELACFQLIASANEAGGKDNITAVIARYSAAKES